MTSLSKCSVIVLQLFNRRFTSESPFSTALLVRAPGLDRLLLRTLPVSPRNDALNVLVYQLKREGLTEGELFERIDANKDGELSKAELQAS